MLKKLIAVRYNQLGGFLLNRRGDFARAERAYRKAAAAAPKWSCPWYNLGLTFKLQRRWRESLECNREALRRNPSDEAAWWNLGIAATALGDWPEARRAWQGFGLELPPGDGEIQMDLGPTPIRLDPKGSAEVVWCERLDPARAVIRNIPFAEAGFHYGDLLLHDGAPRGHRNYHGQTVPVFDAIELLRPSLYRTFEVELHAVGAEALDALFRLALHHDIGLEDWATLRCLCAACSLGNPKPPTPVDSPPVPSGDPVRLMAAAPDESHLRDLLDLWSAAHPHSAIRLVGPAHDAKSSSHGEPG